MKKKIRIIIILLIIFISIYIGLIPSNCLCNSTNEINSLNEDEIMNSQKENYNIKEFINEAKKYTTESFEDINLGDVFNLAVSGKIDNNNLLKCIMALFGKETVNSIKTIGTIFVIIIINSILVSISEGLENKSVYQIAYYVQYILIVTLIMANFTQVIDIVKTSVNNLVSFSNCLIPILIALILSSGNIISSSVIEPVILFMITFMGNFINLVILPITLLSTILAVISKISDRIQLEGLSRFFKSGVCWILSVLLTIFIGVLSIEGTISSSVDGLTAKTTKAAVSSFVPVVGKILSDAVDTVIGCTNILKNAVGIVGIIVVIGICIIPIIKLITLMITYYLGSAICEPIADKRITNLLYQIGDTYKILLAILCSLSVMFIIGITLVIKITNTSLMYR